MRIVLINPPANTIIESHDRPGYPHSGIGYLIAFLKYKGISCDVIDAKLERMRMAEVLRSTLNGRYDVVGISAMTHDITSAAKFAKAVKRQKPNIKVIIGGIHATALPRDTLAEFSAFDYLVYGEGEITLYELLIAVDLGKDYQHIEGIAYREGHEIIVNPHRERVQDLDELPFPDYSSFQKCKEYHIITSRGCPYHCIFCMSPYGREKIRERSPENVIKELKQIEAYHPRLIKFNDETFRFNRSRAIRLLELIRQNNLHKTNKVASLRVDHVDPELLKKMKTAGFSYIDYGIESRNSEILKKTLKGITLEKSEYAIRLTKEVGIRVGENYIIGHPGETVETVRDTIKFATKLSADAIGLMVPYPGTKIAEMAKKGENGYRVLSYNWEDYNKQ